MTALGGKSALPAKSPQERPVYRETPDVVAAVERLIVAVGRRVATEDPEDLVHLHRLEETVTLAWRIAIDGQRSTFSDRNIAEALGVSRPAVTMRCLDRATRAVMNQPSTGAHRDGEQGGRPSGRP
jgi:hypothetical protein